MRRRDPCFSRVPKSWSCHAELVSRLDERGEGFSVDELHHRKMVATSLREVYAYRCTTMNESTWHGLMCLDQTSEASRQKAVLKPCVSMQFGSHYTLFRQDRETNVRTEIAQVRSYWLYASPQAFQSCHNNHHRIGLVVRRSAAIRCPVKTYCYVLSMITGTLLLHMNPPVKQKNLWVLMTVRLCQSRLSSRFALHMSRSRSYKQPLRRVL